MVYVERRFLRNVFSVVYVGDVFYGTIIPRCTLADRFTERKFRGIRERRHLRNVFSVVYVGDVFYGTIIPRCTLADRFAERKFRGVREQRFLRNVFSVVYDPFHTISAPPRGPLGFRQTAFGNTCLSVAEVRFSRYLDLPQMNAESIPLRNLQAHQ